MDFSMAPGTFWFEAWQARVSLLSGLGVTLLSSALSIVMATFCGILMGVALSYGWWWLKLLARLYVDLMRGIPVLVLILFTYYGLALFGQVGAAWGIVLTVVIYLLLIPLSHWWMRRFLYGPAEWLWRSMTYLKLQPMRRHP